ncbi:MAG: PD-(D/E)XK nuclease family protein, partial [Gammaproteobacteria bacterium]
ALLAAAVSAGQPRLGPAWRAHGFLAPPARLAAWLGDAVTPPARASPARFGAQAFADREQELYSALEWARDQSRAAPAARVVVALDDLRGAGALAARCARDVFGSDDGCYLEAPPPLGSDPLLAGALRVLGIAPLMRWDHLSEVLRDATLCGADEERAARARLDAELRALERYELPLALVCELLAREGRCPRLARLLEEVLVADAAQPSRQRLVDWLAHFDALLARAGWPGTDDADERARAREAWTTLCDRLYRLDAVLGPQTRAAALARLRRLLGETPRRQPPARHNVYLVAPTTAVALAPTHLWLAGCESRLLLGGARLSPLLPLEAQRAAGVPGADPARDLWRARLVVEALAAQGTAHQASYAAGDDEARATPSPLVPALAGVTLTAPARYLPRRWRMARVATEALHDSRGPVPDDGTARGGVAVLAAYNACPFRAYARHRLAARELEEPRPGMGARIKGVTVHRCLAALFEEFADHAALLAASDDARRAAVERAVQRGLVAATQETALEREVYFVERRRLVTLLMRWLELEAARAPYTVVAREAPLELDFAGLTLRVRLDRLDRLADGSAVVVDYKTGRCAAGDWQTPRMNEPQLPFYAVAAPLDGVRAVAFAQVDRARPQWLQRPSPDSADAQASWDALAAEWSADLATSVAGILAGDARPAPKRGLVTCRNCEQALVCRLVEHAGAAGTAPADDAGAGEDDDD